MQNQEAATEKTGDVVLDIESLAPSSDKCSGSPKITKALSRKGSSRMERRNGEEQDTEEAAKKSVSKAALPSQLEQLKQPLLQNKAHAALPAATNASNISDCDGRSKKFSRLTTMNPRRILLLFASVSSLGTMILIYFTLAIYWRGGT